MTPEEAISGHCLKTPSVGKARGSLHQLPDGTERIQLLHLWQKEGRGKEEGMKSFRERGEEGKKVSGDTGNRLARWMPK